MFASAKSKTITGSNEAARERIRILRATLRARVVGQEEAVEAGLFGVPSYVVDGEVFWGADALDFVGAFLGNPAILRDVETARLDALPVGVARSR